MKRNPFLLGHLVLCVATLVVLAFVVANLLGKLQPALERALAA
jgi:hypothetical protein